MSAAREETFEMSQLWFGFSVRPVASGTDLSPLPLRLFLVLFVSGGTSFLLSVTLLFCLVYSFQASSSSSSSLERGGGVEPIGRSELSEEPSPSCVSPAEISTDTV